ncbi:MAG: CarD family transcriptional regulator [Acutalibacter sp.]|jgi:CarD family transcriptional regulator
MFQPGDFVVYGSSGVCRVVKVGALESRAADPSREYYTLQPVFESEMIYSPVDSGVFMRPAMTKEQAQNFIREIPHIQGDVCNERNPANLRVHYEAFLQSHQCRQLVSLIKGIRCKCRETEKKGRKMGQVDQRYRKKAEGLLHGELAIALGIPLDQVESYIQENMEEAAG